MDNLHPPARKLTWDLCSFAMQALHRAPARLRHLPSCLQRPLVLMCLICCFCGLQALHRAPAPAHLKHLPAYLKDAGTHAVQQDSQRRGK